MHFRCITVLNIKLTIGFDFDFDEILCNTSYEYEATQKVVSARVDSVIRCSLF